MPVQREARYLSPNDIGKMVTFQASTEPTYASGESVLLGGVLSGLSTEVKTIEEPRLVGVEPEVHYQLTRVVLELSGQTMKLPPHRMVTIYGQDGN